MSPASVDITVRTLALPAAAGGIVGDLWQPRTSRGTVVLLHGGGQTRHSWQNLGARLAVEGWTAFAYDARGHGDSDWTPDRDYAIDGYVADLKTVVGQLDTDAPPVLVGASLGGMTALLGQAENPDLAARLVLVDITPNPRREGVERIRAFMSAHLDGFDSLEHAAEVVRGYNPARRRQASHDGLRKNLRPTSNGRWRWHWDPAVLSGVGRHEPISPGRAEAAARCVSVPTLLVAGGTSDVVQGDEVAAFLTLMPSARSALVPGAGHMVAGDRNDVFGDAIVDFLTD